MKIQMELVVAAIKEMVEWDEDSEFLRRCKENEYFVTINSNLKNQAKQSLDRAAVKRARKLGQSASVTSSDGETPFCPPRR